MDPIRLRINDDKFRSTIINGYGTDLYPKITDPPPASNEVDVFVTPDQMERIKRLAQSKGVVVEEI